MNLRLNLRFRPKKQKTGISAEPYNDRETTYSNTKEQKPQHTQAFLLTALKSNDFVKSLETEQLHKIVQSMERKSVEPKHDIIVEGQVGEREFIKFSLLIISANTMSRKFNCVIKSFKKSPR